MLSLDIILMISGLIIGGILMTIHDKANWELITYNEDSLK